VANLSLLATVQALSSPFPAFDIDIGYTKTARTGENCLPASSDDFRQGFHMQDICSYGNASRAFSPSPFSTLYSVLALARPVILIPHSPALYF